MDVSALFVTVNMVCAIPTTILFCVAALFFTITLRGVQFRSITRFFILARASAISHARRGYTTGSLFYAVINLFGTTIGMGNIVVPSLAIIVGGPGALVWLIIFMVLSAAIKYAEILFTIKTRQTTPEGSVIAGPVQYLRLVAPVLSWWYGWLVLVLFAGWSALQAQALAETCFLYHISPWITGLILTIWLLVMTVGHFEYIHNVIVRWIPLLCIMYLLGGLIIIVTHGAVLLPTMQLMLMHAFDTRAVAGAGMFTMMRAAVYRGTFITEAGLGTSSLPHALAAAKHAHDQSVFALGAVFADVVIALISGLLVLVGGVWCCSLHVTTTLVHHVFVNEFGFCGGVFFCGMLAILVFMTIIGNTTNALQQFMQLGDYRWILWYVLVTAMLVFCGVFVSTELIWTMMDLILALVAIPTLGGLLWLAVVHPQLLRE